MSVNDYGADFLAGRLSLPRVFWLHGFVGMSVLSLVHQLSIGNQTMYKFLAVVLLAYWIAWYVALWRTSTNYTGPAIWKYAARLVVLIPLIGFVFAVAIGNLLLSPQAPASTPPTSQFDPSTARPYEPGSSFSFEEAAGTPQVNTSRRMTIDEFLSDAPPYDPDAK